MSQAGQTRLHVSVLRCSLMMVHSVHGDLRPPNPKPKTRAGTGGNGPPSPYTSCSLHIGSLSSIYLCSFPSPSQLVSLSWYSTPLMVLPPVTCVTNLFRLSGNYIIHAFCINRHEPTKSQMRKVVWRFIEWSGLT